MYDHHRVGLELESLQLVLQRGRDFRWEFDNIDPSTHELTNFPSGGSLFFELQTRGEQNEIQTVLVNAASAGYYTFTFGGQTTAHILYDDVVDNPHNLSGDITDKLEALSTIGAGNVSVTPSSLFPVWEVTLTLNSGQNEIQKITFRDAVNGGTFKLSYGLQFTSALSYGASASTVQTALQGLSGIGSGNCTVTAIDNGYQVEFIGSKADTNVDQIIGWGLGVGFALTGDIFPNKIQTSTLVQGSALLSQELVNALNQSINDFFNSFEALLGVNLDFEILDNKNVKITATSLKSYDESGLTTFAVNVTSNAIEAFLNGVSTFLGVFNTIHVDFYWRHTYQVEFVKALGLAPQALLTSDITGLTGINDEQEVTVTEVQHGVAPLTNWPFSISGSTASIKVESEAADKIQARTEWQLVWMPSGEPAGGDPVALGLVRVQHPKSYVKAS